MSGFITNGSEYNGKEALDILIRPHADRLKADGISVITTEGAGSVKLGFWGKLQKILMPYASGFQGGSGSTIKQKKFEIEEFKAENNYSKQDYKDTIYEVLTNQMGIKQNDITGTQVHDAEVMIFSRGVLADINRIWWLGKKTKRHDAAGTYADGSTTFAIGDVDKHYNVIDGVWTKLIADAVVYTSATHDDVRRITVSNGAVAMVDTVTLTGTSGTATLTIKGKDYVTPTYATSLTVTAAAFVTLYEDELAERNITCTSSTADVILTSSIAGVPLGTTAIANTSGNLDGSVANTTANTLPADLTTDEALSTMKSMYRNSTQELKSVEKASLRYYVTESMYENYEDTLQSGTTEQARTTVVDGVNRYSYNGIAIIPIAIDQWISADFEGAYPHRAILTLPDNLAKILATGNDFAETRMWFNPDENENRQRTQFEFGGGYRFPELITVAY